MKNDKIKSEIESAQHFVTKTLNILTKHRFTLIFIILGAAVGFALIRTRSFIDIPRDEQRYQAETSQIQYKNIDQNILESFSSARADQDVNVDSNFQADRNNPFID